MRSALLCQAKHHIVLSGDAFLRSVGAQALRGGLAKIIKYFLSTKAILDIFLINSWVIDVKEQTGIVRN